MKRPAKRKREASQGPTGEPAKFFSPLEIFEYTGLHPNSLRDWRRRGLTEHFGCVILPDGRVVSADDPATRKLDRPQWQYPLGQMTALAIARHLNAGLGLDLKHALRVATQINAKVLAWIPSALDGPSAASLREPRFVIAWNPSQGGDNPGGVPKGDLATIAVADLNRIAAYAGAASLVLDCKELANELPAALRTYLIEERARG